MRLKFENVTKMYGKRKALKDLNLTLSEGVYALLGENGAGKSTLMRLMTTLQRPTEGKISLDGEDIFLMRERYLSRLGYMAQDFSYYPDFTARDFLRYVCALKGVSNAREKTDEVLRAVGLGDEGKRKIKALSGGMKRRLGIAQAVLGNGDIIVLDEPTAGLDISERARFYEIINSLAKGKAVILSTHIFSDAEFTAENVIMMKKGALVRFGEKEKIEAELDGAIWEGEIYLNTALKDRILKRRDFDKYSYVRIYSKEPPFDGARAAKANLEDVYLTEGEK